jgi:DNA-directed RNA polymerase subunit beta'
MNNNNQIFRNYLSAKISLASPEEIRSWSHGEVTKAETMDYKLFEPEKDGFFDESIFGPKRSYQCLCGKYRPMKNTGKRCEKCNVEYTDSLVRRERMSHIELASPVVHIWMLKLMPSKLSRILEIDTKSLEEVIYFTSYIVLDAGSIKSLHKLQILDNDVSKKTRLSLAETLKEIELNLQKDQEFSKKYNYILNEIKKNINKLEDFNNLVSIDEIIWLINKYSDAKISIGAEAIDQLLKAINLNEEFENLNLKLKATKSVVEKKKISQKLEIVNDFIQSKIKPEWMVLKVLPVIPPDIRPIVQIEKNRFTASDINDLYLRVINRNNSLKAMPKDEISVVINNEKRTLQESVDALLDNERKNKPVYKKKRIIKSLASNLKGKKGRFRQNLLGKRVDYSARSVITVDPNLKMYECALPMEMALVLFKPFVIASLIKNNLASNYKRAKIMCEKKEDIVWKILQDLIEKRPVLLNRAPTLHRLGIQAFFPKLVNSKAIKINPLVTTGFNADFDGDQMAVHLPLTDKAIYEAKSLMLGSKNILSPKDGRPIASPTKDMVLGNYYLTIEKKNEKGEGCIFKDKNEAIHTYENDLISLHSLIGIDVNSFIKNNKSSFNKFQNQLLVTTVGKIIFNDSFPNDFPYLNQFNFDQIDCIDNDIISYNQNIHEFIKKRKLLSPFKKIDLSNIINICFKKYREKTAEILDKLKTIGFYYATFSGVTVSVFDLISLEEKEKYFKEVEEKISQVEENYENGFLTKEERKNYIINYWISVKKELQIKLEKKLNESHDNPLHVMLDSGAGTNIANLTQLLVARFFMTNTKGETIEIPIKHSFTEGLNNSEFFISIYGARKGTTDISLKTADAGYLTRILIDSSQDLIVTTADCGTKKGFIVSDIIDTKFNEIISSLQKRIFGRYLINDLLNQEGNLLISKNKLILEKEDFDIIKKHKIKEIEVRSVLNCEAVEGICQKCYGVDLATLKEVEIGVAVGIIAAQSIGEPGTQLTMWNFHTGGVSGGTDITIGLPRIKELFNVTHPKGTLALISEASGIVTDIEKNDQIYKITIKDKKNNKKEYSVLNTELRVKVGDKIKVGQKITEGAIDLKNLLDISGIIETQQYILKEVQKIYKSQGIEINDKHVEIILKKMFSCSVVEDPGDSDLLSGQVISNLVLNKNNKKLIEENKKIITIKPTILGIKKIPAMSDSFLAAVSFQDTARILTNTAIKGKVDYLKGLKENIIVGNLIPAGTGLYSEEKLNEEIEKSRNDKSYRY